MYTIPNYSWVLRDEPANFDLGYFYPADPSWPLIDRADNDCWGTWTATISSATYDGVVAVDVSNAPSMQLVFDDSGIADADIDGLTDYLIMIEFTVTVDLTTPADDDASPWYVEEGTGASALTDSKTFTVQILEPCTSTNIVFDDYEHTVSMAIGDAADDSSTSDITSAASTWSTYCAVTYNYNDDGCNFCVHAEATGTSTFTITPTDALTSIGSYTLTLEACYTNFPSVCSPMVFVYVTVTGPCS